MLRTSSYLPRKMSGRELKLRAKHLARRFWEEMRDSGIWSIWHQEPVIVWG